MKLIINLPSIRVYESDDTYAFYVKPTVDTSGEVKANDSAWIKFNPMPKKGVTDAVLISSVASVLNAGFPICGVVEFGSVKRFEV